MHSVEMSEEYFSERVIILLWTAYYGNDSISLCGWGWKDNIELPVTSILCIPGIGICFISVAAIWILCYSLLWAVAKEFPV